MRSSSRDCMYNGYSQPPSASWVAMNTYVPYWEAVCCSLGAGPALLAFFLCPHPVLVFPCDSEAGAKASTEVILDFLLWASHFPYGRKARKLLLMSPMFTPPPVQCAVCCIGFPCRAGACPGLLLTLGRDGM